MWPTCEIALQMPKRAQAPLPSEWQLRWQSWHTSLQKQQKRWQRNILPNWLTRENTVLCSGVTCYEHYCLFTTFLTTSIYMFYCVLLMMKNTVFGFHLFHLSLLRGYLFSKKIFEELCRCKVIQSPQNGAS